MQLVEKALGDVRLFRLEAHGDSRGSFMRTFAREVFEAEGLEGGVAHANVSVTHAPGTVRGLHYQIPPSSEAKTVHCLTGRVFDVVVDVRSGSPTYLQWEGFELDRHLLLHVPEGYAHGFQTLERETMVHYLMSRGYDRERERGLRWDDPTLSIVWPLAVEVVSDKDQSYPLIGADWDPGV